METDRECVPGPARPKTRIPLRIEETLAGIAIGLLAIITFLNVVVRYATNFSFAFTEEFSIFLMLVMAFLGGASVMAKNGHLSITYLVDKLPPSIRHIVTLTSTALVVITFGLLGVLGGRMAYDEYRFEVTSPGLGVPTWIYTMWLPILSIAILGRAIGLMIRLWKERA